MIGGIRAAIHGLVANFPTLDLQQIGYAMLGTTHCTNALVERRQLNRVGLIRIGAPATLAIPPYTTWPADLLDMIGRSAVVIIPAGIADGALVYRLAHYDVANAIGAAIAQCSGEVERIFALDQISRSDALEQARQLASAAAIQAGADPATVEIIAIQEVPLAYLPGSATRIRVRVAGNLQLDRSMQPGGGAL